MHLADLHVLGARLTGVAGTSWDSAVILGLHLVPALPLRPLERRRATPPIQQLRFTVGSEQKLLRTKINRFPRCFFFFPFYSL